MNEELIKDNYVAYIKQLQDQYKSNLKLKQSKEEQEIFIRKNSSERIAHVYLFYKTEKKYFRVYRDLNEFRGYGEVLYLGLGIEPKNYVYKGKGANKLKNKRSSSKINSYFKSGMRCCYCDEILNENTCTREHVIPKHAGGKIIYPCCKHCNSEKGGLFLDGYIRLLKSKHLRYPSEVIFNKISNAEKLLSSLNKL